MENRIKIPLEETESVAPKKKEQPKQDNAVFLAIQKFFTKGAMTKESATEALPFVIFLALLAMLYIGNRHSAENNIRKIDRLNKEVKELSWDFKTLKAELMFRSKQTEVAKRVDSVLGLKVPVHPPVKIKVGQNEYKN